MKHLHKTSDAERIMAEVDTAIEQANALLDQLALAHRASHIDDASLNAALAMLEPSRRHQVLEITARVIRNQAAPGAVAPGRSRAPRQMV